MLNPSAFRAVAHGRVQGVYYRASTRNHAREIGVTGTVRNLPDGSVEVIAEGERSRLHELAAYLEKGPPGAKVSRVDIEWLEYSGRFPDFNVLHEKN